MIVVAVMPSLRTLSGDPLMLADVAGGVTNAIVGGILGVSWMLSVVSVAVKVESFDRSIGNLEDYCPIRRLVTPLGGVMTECHLG